MISLTILLDEYVDIAFNYLRRSGELDDAPAANRFLTLSVARMMRHGTLNRLLLSNKAISEYRARRPFVAQPEKQAAAL